MSSFDKQIEEDLEWRIAELTYLKKETLLTPSTSDKYRTYLRALWTLLYAHYEGFSKFAWDLYLDHIKSSKINRCDCKEPIQILSLEKEFKRLRGDLSHQNIWNFINLQVPFLLSECVELPITLSTNNNLWPDIFIENMNKIGIPHESITSEDRKIKALVLRRNEIAHGKRMIIKSLDEYMKYEKATLKIMDELSVNLSKSIKKRDYID